MRAKIEARGEFPVAIYAVGGNFIFANKLHECAAIISLIEELRTSREKCNINKVASILFAGRTSVARRIIHPLLVSGLVLESTSGDLSICENDDVRNKAISLSELSFGTPRQDEKLLLIAENIPDYALSLVAEYQVCENLPKSLSAENFSQQSSININEEIKYVSSEKKVPFFMKLDFDSNFLVYKHKRSGDLNIVYYFKQEIIDAEYMPGELCIKLDGDDINEKYWGWLIGPLNKIMKSKPKWEVKISTPADSEISNSLIRTLGLTFSKIPGYVKNLSSNSVNKRPFFFGKGLFVRTDGLLEIPEDESKAIDYALDRLAERAHSELVIDMPPIDFVRNFCKQFEFDLNPSQDEISQGMIRISANMDGATYSRLFASSDWRICS